MFETFKLLFGDERRSGRSLRSTEDERDVPEQACKLARRLVHVVLDACNAGDQADSIEEMRIAPYRSLIQVLPIRVYVYTLGSIMGDMEFQSMLRSQHATGAVFDAFELAVEGLRCGFYIYSLQPISDVEFLRDLWQRLRSEVGAPVRTADLPAEHMEHHRSAARNSENMASYVPITGSPDELAENLIRPHLPEKFLDDLSLENDEDIAELLVLLMRRMGRASIEKDELLRFVQRNESALREKVLEFLPSLVQGAKLADEGFGTYLDYFQKNVELALAGKEEMMNMRSDRLFWFLFAMALQIDENSISYTQACELIARPKVSNRISEHQLIYMLFDFADAIDTPQQASMTLLMLVAECAMIAGLPKPLRAAATLVGKHPIAKHRSALVGLLSRAGNRLRLLGEDDTEIRVAKDKLVERTRSVPDDDF